MKKALRILAAILVCELAGVIGSVFTTPSIPGRRTGQTALQPAELGLRPGLDIPLRPDGTLRLSRL